MTEDARIGQLRRRVELDPMSIAFAALAEEYRRQGNAEEAVAVCRTGLTRHPAYLSARVTLGRALLDLNQLDAAEAELQEVLRRAPDNLAALRALAELHQRGSGASLTPPVSNVIPFHGNAMPADIRTCAPALTSLDRFLDAIVTLKRAAV
jgi:tetratricopeptide (TPR) repeat protein